MLWKCSISKHPIASNCSEYRWNVYVVFVVALPKEWVVFVGIYNCISQGESELTRRSEEVCICWSTRKDLCTGLLFILLYCIVYFLCNVHLIIQLQIGAWLYNYLESQPSWTLPYLVFVLFLKWSFSFLFEVALVLFSTSCGWGSGLLHTSLGRLSY